jgi:hypothetical protein
MIFSWAVFPIHSEQKLYSAGIDRVINADKTTVMIASPEKALCLFTRNLNRVALRELQALLFEDLRVDGRPSLPDLICR